MLFKHFNTSFRQKNFKVSFLKKHSLNILPNGPYADLVVSASSLQASIFRSTASSNPDKCCKAMKDQIIVNVPVHQYKHKHDTQYLFKKGMIIYSANKMKLFLHIH